MLFCSFICINIFVFLTKPLLQTPGVFLTSTSIAEFSPHPSEFNFRLSPNSHLVENILQDNVHLEIPVSTTWSFLPPVPVTWDAQNTRYPCPIHTGPISPSDNIQWYSCDPLLLLLHPGPFLCCPNATEHVGFRHTHICPDSDNNVRLKKRENELIKEVRHDY